MKVFKKIILVLAIILALAAIAYVCYGFYLKATVNYPNPVATMEIEGFGTVKIELYPDKAPNTVANFIRLANRGFYDGLTFHRTVPEFMIQGGDKNGNGTGSPSLSDIRDDIQKANDNTVDENKSNEDKNYNISGEFIANGFTKNNIKHERGVISMARSDYGSYSSELTTYGYNSAGSQFFIMTKDNNSLDGLYAAFGKVIEGMDIIDKVANVEVYYRDGEYTDAEEDDLPKDSNGNTIYNANTPKKAPVIKSITVETYGVDYGIPKTLNPFDYTSWLMQQYNFQ